MLYPCRSCFIKRATIAKIRNRRKNKMINFVHFFLKKIVFFCFRLINAFQASKKQHFSSTYQIYQCFSRLIVFQVSIFENYQTYQYISSIKKSMRFKFSKKYQYFTRINTFQLSVLFKYQNFLNMNICAIPILFKQQNYQTF